MSEPWRRVLVLSLLVLFAGASTAETVTYYYTNQQGTPLATADASGNILTTSDYRPYGSQVLGSPAGGPGYTGHVNDPDTGLVYMQARYYDPVVGRFLSVDPSPDKEGKVDRFGPYSYANDNPVGNVDPDGRVPIVTRRTDGSISVQYPVIFAGAEASSASNREIFISQVAAMSGNYVVNGKATNVNFETTTVTKGLFTGTPSKAVNTITLMKGSTSDPTGRSNADLGGNKTTIRTDDRFGEGVAQHEVLHLGGVDDQKSPDGGIIPNNDDIMNTVPGRISSSDVETLINSKGNVQRDETK
ncbi:RHS repeat-associated core domain-containing protein [Luteibacter sp. OK325]|uniref:RHS repeat-associated core domain-containing protein n=1 Tax=Luteibacter sp. OK325 TaxID=2135670 RepID=UPI0013049B45|nr:RHS repeat-associated core domain-containing protein [Luteibacter sp. OK325]